MDFGRQNSMQQAGGGSSEHDTQLCPSTTWPATHGDDTYTVAEAVESAGNLLLKLSPSLQLAHHLFGVRTLLMHQGNSGPLWHLELIAVLDQLMYVCTANPACAVQQCMITALSNLN